MTRPVAPFFVYAGSHTPGLFQLACLLLNFIYTILHRMMDCAPEFRTHQILCLEHQNAYLYVELVQLVSERQLCWVRPLALKILQNEWTGNSYSLAVNPLPLIDLRQGADLLWPIRSFRVALDVEVMPVLAELQAMQDNSDRTAQQKLREFIQQVWQANSVDASAVDEPDQTR